MGNNVVNVSGKKNTFGSKIGTTQKQNRIVSNPVSMLLSIPAYDGSVARIVSGVELGMIVALK
jgi:hypothetical protein